MTRSEFQAIIKSALLERGFAKVKGRSNEYFLDAPDGITRFVLRTPDMKKGFVLGAQFDDLGGCDGWFTHTVMAQYDFESLLAFPMELGVTEEDTRAGVAQVLEAYEPYFVGGKAAIAEPPRDTRECSSIPVFRATWRATSTRFWALGLR